MSEISNHTLVSHAKELARRGRHADALRLLSLALSEFPYLSLDILAAAYDIAQAMPDKSRYAQYQSRYFDFDVKPGDKVLDMGSGHIPFPHATHLADISISNDNIGRAGNLFKYQGDKPVFECSIENTPFSNKEFDFVYCSHVLEHVSNPETACRELMRIGRRGYIECPTRGKDTFFATAKISNHHWAVECLNGVLIFTEYSEREKKGIECDILLTMNCSPQNMREKAIAGLGIIKASELNIMLLWEDSFPYEVRWQKMWPAHIKGPNNLSSSQEILHLPELSRCRLFILSLHRKINLLRAKIASKLASLIEPGV